jgi:hypothetical protein
VGTQLAGRGRQTGHASSGTGHQVLSSSTGSTSTTGVLAARMEARLALAVRPEGTLLVTGSARARAASGAVTRRVENHELEVDEVDEGVDIEVEVDDPVVELDDVEVVEDDSES